MEMRQGKHGRSIPANWRHEEKYLLSEAAFQRFYYQLRPVLAPDSHAIPPAGAGDGLWQQQRPPASFDLDPYPAYHIRSLYWDTYEQHGLFEKLAGIDARHKFRIRIYNHQDQVIHLEKKIKRGDLTRKLATHLTREQTDRLLAGDSAVLLEVPGLGEEMYGDIRTRLLAPRLLVDYIRVPLVWTPGNVRITFDRQLATGLYRTDLFDPDAGLQPILLEGQTILEVKYDRIMPDFICDLLPLGGASVMSISKYVLCSQMISHDSWSDPPIWG
jgi:hypothetical protein